MPVTLVNPYVTLADLKAELKMKEVDVQYDDTLLTAINLASRWVDDYRGRDFYGHDFRMAALLVDQFWDMAYDSVLYLPWNVREVAELTEGGAALGKGSGYTFREAPAALDRRLFRLGANWNPVGGISIKGKFGGDQWATLEPVISPLPTHPAFSLTLTNPDPVKNNALLYWRLVDPGGNMASLQFFLEDTFTTEVANIGNGLTVPTPWTNVLVKQMNASGYTGMVSSGPISPTGLYTGTVQLRNDLLDSSLVPTDLPGIINLGAKLVAAALSGHNRKEVAGLDGQKLEIHDNRIPKTVFDMFGRRLPVIL